MSSLHVIVEDSRLCSRVSYNNIVPVPGSEVTALIRFARETEHQYVRRYDGTLSSISRLTVIFGRSHVPKTEAVAVKSGGL